MKPLSARALAKSARVSRGSAQAWLKNPGRLSVRLRDHLDAWGRRNGIAIASDFTAACPVEHRNALQGILRQCALEWQFPVLLSHADGKPYLDGPPRPDLDLELSTIITSGVK